MSRIDDLISERCPTGVPYRNLTDVAEYVRGVTYNKGNEQADGPVSLLRANNISLATNTLNYVDVKRVSASVRVRENQRLIAGDNLICAGSGSKDHIGKVAFIFEDLDHTFGGFMGVVRAHGELEPRFLFHLLTGGSFLNYLRGALSTTTINNLNAGVMKGFRIPVPPLEVQRAIVEVLDTFSMLEAELEAELEARKQQYEHYQRQVFNKLESEGAKLVQLSELGNWYGGGTPSKNRSDFWLNGTIPWVSPKDMGGSSVTETEDHITPDAVSASATKLVPKDSVAIVARSSILEHTLPVAYVPISVALNQDMKAVVPAEGISTRYVFHALRSSRSEMLRRVKRRGGSVASLDSAKLWKFEIPVPSIGRQAEIVALLDKFDSIVNDISIGLPAELTARRQQYEFYRDKLLTFKELEVVA